MGPFVLDPARDGEKQRVFNEFDGAWPAEALREGGSLGTIRRAKRLSHLWVKPFYLPFDRLKAPSLVEGLKAGHKIFPDGPMRGYEHKRIVCPEQESVELVEGERVERAPRRTLSVSSVVSLPFILADQDGGIPLDRHSSKSDGGSRSPSKRSASRGGTT